MPGFLGKTVRLIGTDTWGRWVVLLLLALLASAFEATGAVMIFLMMGLITGQEQIDLPVLGDLDDLLPGMDRQEQLLLASGVIALFFLARALVKVGEAYWQGRVAHQAGASLSSRLMDGYLGMPYEFHLRRNSSVLIRNAYDSVQVFVREVLNSVTTIASEAMVVIALMLVLLVTAPLAAGLALAFLGPMTYMVLRVVHPRVKRMGRQSQERAETSLKTLQHSLGGIRDIRVLGRQRFFSEQYRHERDEFARAQYLRQAAKQIPRETIEASLMLFIVAFFAVTVLQGGSAAQTLSVLALFGYAALRIKPPLTNILTGLNALKFAAPAVDDLYADLITVEEASNSGPPAKKQAPLPFRDTIHIRDVSYRYEGTDEDVLHQVDIAIRRGESIGIVGPTGGGKSTLADIVLGLLAPREGQVLVDGVDIAEHAMAWQANLGVVSQVVFLVDDTLRRNICLGLPDAEIDEQRLADAVRMSQLDEFIERLPDGLETMVGERGVRVSGGQRQRIAIARALYHEPEVLVFDEGTSALDTVTENEIVDALDALRGQRTIITIAHRLSTIQSCDRIVLLQAGHLVDIGSYPDLLGRNSDFRAMAGVA